MNPITLAVFLCVLGAVIGGIAVVLAIWFRKVDEKADQTLSKDLYKKSDKIQMAARVTLYTSQGVMVLGIVCLIAALMWR